VPQPDPPTDPNANCCDRLLEGVDERDLAGADHRRRRVDLDHRQPPASLGNRVPSRVCAFSLTRCVSICFCQVSRSTIGGVAVMLVSFDACQVTSRMRTAGPRSDRRPTVRSTRFPFDYEEVPEAPGSGLVYASRTSTASDGGQRWRSEQPLRALPQLPAGESLTTSVRPDESGCGDRSGLDV
jgi:hypothetical protein